MNMYLMAPNKKSAVCITNGNAVYKTTDGKNYEESKEKGSTVEASALLYLQEGYTISTMDAVKKILEKKENKPCADFLEGVMIGKFIEIKDRVMQIDKLDIKNYNKTYRYWKTKPTEEEMASAKWLD